MNVPLHPLAPQAFARFGRVIECGLGEVIPINAGTCERHHALAEITHAPGREPIVSIFRAEPRALPVTIAMMERHPLGSQAFVPMRRTGGGAIEAWIAVVAPDDGGRPGAPIAFRCRGDQGVSYAANVWHHPLIALHARSDFLVADSRGEAPNLEEADYADTWTLDAPGLASGTPTEPHG